MLRRLTFTFLSIQALGTLEEVAMPQNGIYHIGITALSEGLRQNSNLRILNLNDNTLTARGAAAIAKALLYLPGLRSLNFGDCLLKTKGAQFIAEALSDKHTELEVYHCIFKYKCLDWN